MMEAITPLSAYDDTSLDGAFQALTNEVRYAARQLATPEAQEGFRLDWLGRKQGRLKLLSETWLKSAPPEAKKALGMRFNTLKAEIETALSADPSKGIATAIQGLDLSLPGTCRSIGVEHPLTRTMREMTAVFAALGYSVGVGPEVETDFYNFEALNFPPNHPARDTQDTLVVAGQERKPLRERLLMRTHTSPVQIRSMVANPPPLRIVIPGKVHRNDESDATHSPIFHQVEGLCVDTDITFSDLKGTLDHAMKAFFGSAVKTRFFPSYFPFTEPSADVQISCPFCGGKGCRKCKHSGWIELLGCGMVDPAVFAAVDARRIENGLEPAYDTKKISGFAFGMGVERIAMMKYGVGDIGQFYSGDLRFLSQFA
ncbi:MAG: phenylalanine--tRNA ligase subunit alpha [Janthinobacterium lividum]